MEHRNLNNNQITVQAGLSNGLIGNAFKSGRGLHSDSIEKILLAYPEINAEWFVTGAGPMIGHDLPTAVPAAPGTGIPLVSLAAIAGFGSGDFSIAAQDVKDFYVIPKFKNNRVDFMIEVSGSSMYPKYNSGDIVACTIIKEESFIQWNKCHVIATREQGILVKRIKKGEADDRILAVSDNKDYDPFHIPKKEITGIALVIGVIRLE